MDAVVRLRPRMVSSASSSKQLKEASGGLEAAPAAFGKAFSKKDPDVAVIEMDGERRSSFGGVALDVDSMHGYGPETVTFDDSTQDGAYHLVVHSKSREESWLGSDAHALIVLRGSSNLIIVKPTADVLADTCHTQECVSGSCCYWWIGTVNKTRGDAYDFASANVVIGKPSTC